MHTQVLGDIYMAHDIGPDDIVIVGKDGLLLAGICIIATCL